MYFSNAATIGANTPFCIFYARSAPTFADTVPVDRAGTVGGPKGCVPGQDCIVVDKVFSGGAVEQEIRNSNQESCSQACLRYYSNHKVKCCLHALNDLHGNRKFVPIFN